jgi:3-isopropylmalate/(R)-2-methylmalate dehydratase small subunit
MLIAGRVILLGDDVSTDLIYPGRYLTVADRTKQAQHAMEGMGAEWPERLRAFPIVAAGWNFGCGSSREQAATALLGAGVKLVVAKSFSRLYMRNCINNGLPVIESAAIVDQLATGTVLSADIGLGQAQIGDDAVTFAPLPASLLAIIQQGGLLAQLRTQEHRA